MFRNTATAAEPLRDVTAREDLVAWSVIRLDLDVPAERWAAFLAARDVEIVSDDLGRDAISRVDAKMLLTERAENEARKARHRKLVEAQAVADDQLRRASIWAGVPATALPEGVSASSVMLQAAKDAQPKRTSVLQEALAGESLTYHSYQTSPEDDS